VSIVLALAPARLFALDYASVEGFVNLPIVGRSVVPAVGS
jgi:hypothetical protein